VFFSDGTFAGPDTTNFFDAVEACVAASRDLVDEIAFASRRGQSSEGISNYVDEVANTPYPSRKLVPGDFYTIYKKTHAQEFLRIKARTGQGLSDLAARQGNGRWLKLRKL
jgi:hypothetical protein